MKKIPDEIDNPIDNFLISFSEYLCPIFKKMNFTPNGITTLSLFFGLASIYYLYYENMIGFSITYFISYFFDCMDGHYARKYKMITKFGDLYDHCKDFLIYFLILVIVYQKYRKVITFPILFIFFLSLFLMFLHLGCQQKFYCKSDKDTKETLEPETLDTFQTLCKNKSWIYFTRFMGCGTFVVISIFLINFLHYKNKLI